MAASHVSDRLIIKSHKGPYTVFFDEGALAQLAADIPYKAHFIIDRRVAELYREKMVGVLAAPSVLLIEATETNKSLNKFPCYVDHLVSHGLQRDHALIAIGGARAQEHVQECCAPVPWSFGTRPSALNDFADGASTGTVGGVGECLRCSELLPTN